MEVQELLLKRRSVYPKQFTGEIIPKPALLKAFEAANWAPTHKRTQPWRFIVYTGESLNALVDQWKHLAERNMLVKGEPWTEAMENKYMQFRKCSHIIGLACHYSGLVPEVEETCATAASVQNFWLSLHDQGYTGYWSTGNGVFGEEMHAYMQLEENEKALGYFLAGVAEGVIPPSVRKPVEEFVRWM